jgi:hypothetical protein
MMSVLVPGKAAIVLFGEISGRRTFTSCCADSLRNVMTFVTSRSPPPLGLLETSDPCILPSASSTSLVTPLPSIATTPCSRNADSSVG